MGAVLVCQTNSGHYVCVIYSPAYCYYAKPLAENSGIEELQNSLLTVCPITISESPMPEQYY